MYYGVTQLFLVPFFTMNDSQVWEALQMDSCGFINGQLSARISLWFSATLHEEAHQFLSILSFMAIKITGMGISIFHCVCVCATVKR